MIRARTNMRVALLLMVALLMTAIPTAHAMPDQSTTPDTRAAAKPWPGVPLPGLESDPPNTVRLEACAVRIVNDKVRVDTSVSTVGDTPALLLEGTLFGWSGASDPYSTRHFPELSIRVDGAPATLEERYESFMGKRNISTMLRLTGMNPLAVVRTPPLTTADASNAPMVKALVNAGAVEKTDDGYLAKWQTRRVLRIPLDPAPQKHRVEWEYQARPAVSVTDLEQLDTALRETSYCVSSTQLHRLAHTRAGMTWLVTEYTLPTGIDQTPAKALTLSMFSGGHTGMAPRPYIFFCGPHAKPIAKRGAFNREPAGVDESGSLHVLRVAESTEPAAR